MKITLITGNAGKAEEVSRYLGTPVEHRSLDLEEIVKDKATRAFEKIGEPVLVEDVSFVFHSLGKLPGPLIKWFLKELGNEGLCRLVDGKDRACIATVCYGFHNGKEIKPFKGSMSGMISDSPRGNNSFGWASVFIPEAHEKTYAELSNEEQAPIAMRGKALKDLHDFLVSNK